MADLKPHLARVFRFAIVGLANTALGLGLIYALDLGLHVQPQLANGIGYVAGALLSFFLQKTFVFRSSGRLTTAGPRFVAVILAAFALNQLVLLLGLSVLGNGAWQHAAAQLGGAVAYTASSFLAFQFWVFPSQKR
ncbi:MAG: GtrA family protein [Phenylobacterium sp.]